MKSEMKPWEFASAKSVKWIIEHPLPIFLCVVQKDDARILVYSTTPRFAAWVLPTPLSRLELIPGRATKAKSVEWGDGGKFEMKAPILNFTIQELLDDAFRAHIANVLKFWIEYDMRNLIRIRCGIPRFQVPAEYETNSTSFEGWAIQGAGFRDESVRLAQNHLEELLGIFTKHYRRDRALTSAAICAMALRHLAPDRRSPTPEDPHIDQNDVEFHNELNRLFGMEPPSHLYAACDLLLNLVKIELARHGICDSPATPTVVE
ncbi:hypothetical protein [Cupriavidus basilensis]